MPADPATSLVLPEELSIYTAAALRDEWLAWLHAPHESTAVDASAVLEVDAAGVQLLQSLCNSLARQQRPWQLLRPSDALSQACTALGVAALLGAADAAGARA